MFDINNYHVRKDGIELRKLNANDWDVSPEVWNNDIDMHADLLRVPAWAMLYTKDDPIPHLYIRNHERNKVRERYGIIQPGVNPTEPQKSVHRTDIAQEDSTVIPYQKIETDPDTYQFTAYAPFSQLTFTENGEHWIEGDAGSVLDLKAELFPFAIFYHSDSIMASPYFIQFLELSGTYQGKPIRALGGSDRVFVPSDTGENGLLTPIRKAKYSPLTYIHCMLTGVREDGKKEIGSFMITELGAYAVYWLEGEEPYMTSNLTLEADWQKPPYLPEDDQTMSFTNATWKFDDREVHFNGKWNMKGLSHDMRLETPGLIEIFGEWYAGDTEYKHDMNFTFFEISRMPKDVLIDLGLLK